MRKDVLITKGDIYYVDLGDTVGSEVRKVRPCVIIQNNTGNKFAPTTIIIPISNRSFSQPTQVILKNDMMKESDVSLTGLIITEQIRTVDRNRLVSKIGSLTHGAILQVEKAVLVSMGIKIAV